jgi:hypothetical protein
VEKEPTKHNKNQKSNFSQRHFRHSLKIMIVAKILSYTMRHDVLVIVLKQIAFDELIFGLMLSTYQKTEKENKNAQN